MTESFTVSNGIWDNAGNWSSSVPSSSTWPVDIGSNVDTLTINGNDAAYWIFAQGTSDLINTIDITSTLAATAIETLSNFSLLEGAYGYVTMVGGIANVSNSFIDIAGTANIQNFAGNQGTVSGSTLKVEAGGTLISAFIGTISNSSIDIAGYASLNGYIGGGLGGLTGSTIVVESTGTLTTGGIDGQAGDTLIVNGTLT